MRFSRLPQAPQITLGGRGCYLCAHQLSRNSPFGGIGDGEVIPGVGQVD